MKSCRKNIAANAIIRVGFNLLNGQTEVFKTDLNAELSEVQLSDAVVVQSAEAKVIHIKK